MKSVVIAQLKKVSGFTMVEVLIGLVITAFIAISLFMILGMIYGTNEQVSSQAMSLQQARKCVDEIADSIRFATSISEVTDNSIRLTNEGGTSTISYDSGDKQVYRTNASGEKTALTRGYVQAVRFILDPDDEKGRTIIIQMTVNEGAGKKIRPTELRTVVSTLNR